VSPWLWVVRGLVAAVALLLAVDGDVQTQIHGRGMDSGGDQGL
jgi:hypothetical protein